MWEIDVRRFGHTTVRGRTAYRIAYNSANDKKRKAVGRESDVLTNADMRQRLERRAHTGRFHEPTNGHRLY
jgi:hypothetical protein